MTRVLTSCVAGALASAAVLAQYSGVRDPLWDRRAEGAGDFQTVFEVSGRAELALYRVAPNPVDLRSICEAQTTTERLATEESAAVLQGLLAAPASGRSAVDLAWAYRTVGQLHAYHGELDRAVEAFQAALATAERSARSSTMMRVASRALEQSIAVASLRQGELDNCVFLHNADRCIYPIRGGGVHQRREGSTRAVEYFTKALASDPGNLEVRWLLNVAYMTLGRHPDGVPQQHRIAVSPDASADVPRFRDVAPERGLQLQNRAGGAIVDDFDGDGRLDVVLSSLGPCDPLRLYRNTGTGLEDVTERAGLLSQTGGINISHADFDNDGRLDVFVHRGGWEYPMRNSLLRNNPDGTFTDVTEQTGLLERPSHRTHTAAWADYDNDGWVDLFVGHEESPSALYRNQGDGTFLEMGRKAGVAHVAFTKGATWGDYDNDALPDLYVSNFAGRNFLYRNKGDGTFEEVAGKLGVDRPLMSFATWFFDYDNDGWLDLFVASFVPSVDEVVRGLLGLPPRAETMRLYRNTGRGGFVDVTAEVGLDRVWPVMGANFGDIDNDGWLDLYLGTGAPSYAALVPNVLFRNVGGRRFVDATVESGTGHLQKGHGVAIGDLDGDGTDELVVNVGGFVPGDAYWKAIFATTGPKGTWLNVQLVGEKSNRFGLGARLRIVTTEGGRAVERHRVVSTGGSFGASPHRQHIGLGSAPVVDRLEVVWPATGVRQTFSRIPAGQTIEVREGRSIVRVASLPSVVHAPRPPRTAEGEVWR